VQSSRDDTHLETTKPPDLPILFVKKVWILGVWFL